jgi:hypothetical protein
MLILHWFATNGGWYGVELANGWKYTQVELVHLLQNYVASDDFQQNNFAALISAVSLQIISCLLVM